VTLGSRMNEGPAEQPGSRGVDLKSDFGLGRGFERDADF